MSFALLLLPAFIPIPGWEPRTGDPTGPNKIWLRWTTPESNTDPSGLGKGIAYVIEEDFCEKMIPSFRDCSGSDCWVNCHEINGAILRAFANYEANHALLRFVNVTEPCMREPAVAACRANIETQCTELGLEDNFDCVSQRGNCTKLCTEAELFITSEEMASHETTVGGDTIAFVKHWKSVGLTEAESALITEANPRLPTGDHPSFTNGIIRKSTFTVLRNHKCFYLDNTFCGGLHDMENRNGISVIVFFAIVCFLSFTIAMVILLIKLCRAGCTFAKHKGGWSRGFHDSLQILSDRLMLTWVVLFLVISGPTVRHARPRRRARPRRPPAAHRGAPSPSSQIFFEVVQPCMDCFDFEAMTTHEVGHVLGLGHPDVGGDVANIAFKEGARLDASTCANATLAPWQEGGLTEIHPLPEDNWVIMLSLATKIARPCLSDDDLEGLNALYPTCSHARQLPASPICIRSKKNRGVIRMFMYIFVPFLVTAMLSLCCVKATKRDAKKNLANRRLQLALRLPTEKDERHAAVAMQKMYRAHHPHHPPPRRGSGAAGGAAPKPQTPRLLQEARRDRV